MVEVDPYKIRGVQDRVSQVLSTKEFVPGEIMYGLAEFLGRMVVGYVPGTWITKKEVFDSLCQHMETTIKVGIQKEQN